MRIPSKSGIKTLVAFGIKSCAAGVLIAVAVGLFSAFALVSDDASALTDWSESTDYAVYFPRSNGDDLQAIKDGTDGISKTVAERIYPELDDRGGIYVEAADMDVVGDDPVLPYVQMSVNTNYLEKYPILDSSGKPIAVSDEETDWVIAVPETLKDREDLIRDYVQESRNGPSDSDVEYAEANSYEVSDAVRKQKVRIVWTQPGQDLFTFDTQIRPKEGNTLPDPIVTVMTRSNTIASDWENTITGEIDTPMKVRVDGDPEKVYQELLPLFEKYELDDNFTALVYPADAINEQFSLSSEDARWLITAAVVAGALTVVLSIVAVVVAYERWRVHSAIRRLHGYSRLKSFGEVFAGLATSWLLLIPAALVATTSFYVLGGHVAIPEYFHPLVLLDEWPALLAVTGSVVLVEAVIAIAVVMVFDRRHPALRLKEI
ncbi:hypothetical protein [Brevibacterium sp. FME37]|uniref:hypothetical protein n=1 Tax=Brevibacterium sp. FME37 TaxID=2742607 RepID=UPI001865AD78|nr:hypothetical protein [Brevibacterium sp. FME37]